MIRNGEIFEYVNSYPCEPEPRGICNGRGIPKNSSASPSDMKWFFFTVNGVEYMCTQNEFITNRHDSFEIEKLEYKTGNPELLTKDEQKKIKLYLDWDFHLPQKAKVVSL